MQQVGEGLKRATGRDEWAWHHLGILIFGSFSRNCFPSCRASLGL